jgi:hypothetical protein
MATASSGRTARSVWASTAPGSASAAARLSVVAPSRTATRTHSSPAREGVAAADGVAPRPGAQPQLGGPRVPGEDEARRRVAGDREAGAGEDLDEVAALRRQPVRPGPGLGDGSGLEQATAAATAGPDTAHSG